MLATSPLPDIDLDVPFISGYKDASQKGKEWRYHMPDEKKGKEVDKYGEADDKEALPGYEQKQWEEKHTAAGTLKSGN